jgi:hypothetical protein
MTFLFALSSLSENKFALHIEINEINVTTITKVSKSAVVGNVLVSVHVLLRMGLYRAQWFLLISRGIVPKSTSEMRNWYLSIGTLVAHNHNQCFEMSRCTIEMVVSVKTVNMYSKG